MKKELLGTNPDGTPHYLFTAEPGDELVLTGPIAANLTMRDGTVYDVTDPVVCPAPEHHDELVHAIGDHYEENGFPGVPGFVHDVESTQRMLQSRKES